MTATQLLRRAAANVVWRSGLVRLMHQMRHPGARQYRAPSDSELAEIELALGASGIEVLDYEVPTERLADFQGSLRFPPDYAGGLYGGVWEEKMLEHLVAFDLLRLNRFTAGDVYVDVAAGTSPWAMTLRDCLGVEAFALDLTIDQRYAQLGYYLEQDATRMTFASGSVSAMSLQCAYEMFSGDDDIGLLREAARVLRPAGGLVICPLYLHTHYCAYSTPEFWGRGHAPPAAVEYVRYDCRDIPSSRKYDAHALQERVLRTIDACGMTYRLYALRNKRQLSPHIYCHFILEIRKLPGPA